MIIEFFFYDSSFREINSRKFLEKFFLINCECDKFSEYMYLISDKYSNKITPTSREKKSI